MPAAEIITIGTELLLGEIQDTNTREIAVFLKESGIDLFRATIVGDNTKRIASAIRDALSRVDILITTGGLGPTVDDPTREAVALAVGRETVFDPKLWSQIQQRFNRFGRVATENNKRQAFIPSGASPVENQVGTAPAFILEIDDKVIISLPGVPRELQYLLQEKVRPYLKSRFQTQAVIIAKTLHASGIGESQVDAVIGDLETSSNPTVGLLAHPGQVDIRVTVKAKNEAEAQALIQPFIDDIKQRLSENIYGEDDETLERIIHAHLMHKNLLIFLLHKGLDETLQNRLKAINSSAINLHKISTSKDIEKARVKLALEKTSKADIIFSANLIEGAEVQRLELVMQTPEHLHRSLLTYGGPPLLRYAWAANQILDFIRRKIQDQDYAKN